MSIELELQCESSLNLPSRSQFAVWIEAAVAAADPSLPGDCRYSLVVRVVGLEEGLALNRDYRQRDYATNILSFPFEAPPGLPPQENQHLGDLVICAPIVEREAEEQGKSLESHWAHLTVHGTLHLLGYDHAGDEEAEQMETMERNLLTRLGFPDPYGEE